MRGRLRPLREHHLLIMLTWLCVTGGGCWHPEAQRLALLRRDVDRKPHRMKQVLTNDRLRKEFLGGASKSEKDVVKAFVKSRSNAESALKTKPKVSEPSLTVRMHSCMSTRLPWSRCGCPRRAE